MPELRAYQIDLLNKTRQAYREGKKRPCIVLPCGGGKSCLVAEMAKQATRKGNYVQFLVHRKELCGQIERTFINWGVDMFYCRVDMVQTVSRKTDKIPPPSLIITDENHHCLASTYLKIYKAFPDARCVGVTATPVRLNGSGLGDVNDALIEGVTAKWLIANQYLAPYDYYSPSVADLTGLTARAGEFDALEIEKRLSSPAIYGDVTGYYRQLAEGKKAVCYCATLEHSKTMARQFAEAGIPAAHVDGTTSKGERERIIEGFRQGGIQILCNVDLISEGFDVPDCGAVILLRPTKSLTLYIQQAMRCMRYQPGKRAVIIDHVGNYARFGLPDQDREWSLEPVQQRKKTTDEIRVQQCPHCWATLENTVRVCPKCGFVFRQEEKQEEIKVMEAAKLERITNFTIRAASPAQCRNMEELREFAKQRGYKPGYAYFMGKKMGLIN